MSNTSITTTSETVDALEEKNDNHEEVSHLDTPAATPVKALGPVPADCMETVLYREPAAPAPVRTVAPASISTIKVLEPRRNNTKIVKSATKHKQRTYSHEARARGTEIVRPFNVPKELMTSLVSYNSNLEKIRMAIEEVKRDRMALLGEVACLNRDIAESSVQVNQLLHFLKENLVPK